MTEYDTLPALLAEFETPEGMLRAVRLLKRSSFTHVETIAPFDVPGVDEELELPRPRLGIFVLAAGVVGLVASYGIQWWANVHSYPLNVGGRPQHAIPAFVFASFEGAVLAAAVAAFVGVLLILRLPALWSAVDEIDGFERASIDRFWVAVRQFAGPLHRDLAERLLREAGALRTVSIEE